MNLYDETDCLPHVNPDGGPAFPHDAYALTDNGEFNHRTVSGMSLRDWFAGQALAGYFAAPHTEHRNAACSETAEYIYAMADAMLAARADAVLREAGE